MRGKNRNNVQYLHRSYLLYFDGGIQSLFERCLRLFK
jgi:hypothetical protein